MDEFNKKEKIKNPNKKYVVIIVILISVVAVIIAGIYFTSVVGKQKEENEITPVVSFTPFSGTVFEIDSNEVNSILMIDGKKGRSETTYDRDIIENVVDCLNSFDAKFTVPVRTDVSADFSYMIGLETNDGKMTYTVESYYILVKDMWYVGEDNCFQELMDILDDALPAVE